MIFAAKIRPTEFRDLDPRVAHCTYFEILMEITFSVHFRKCATRDNPTHILSISHNLRFIKTFNIEQTSAVVIAE